MNIFIQDAQDYAPLNPNIVFLRGLIMHDRANLQRLSKAYIAADELFTDAQQFGENHALLRDKAYNNYKREKYSEAIDDLSRAIILSPEDADYYYRRAQAYGNLKQYEKAADDIERANLLNPNDKYTKKKMKWLASRLASKAYKLNKVYKSDLAIKYSNMGLRLSPNNPWLYYRRARALNHKDQIDLAIQDIKKSIELDQDNIDFYVLLDAFLVKKKDWKQIISYWDKFIALHPDNGRAFLERAGTYYHDGDLEAAVKNAKKAVDLGNPNAKKAYHFFKKRLR